jgi:hypothetical protein
VGRADIVDPANFVDGVTNPLFPLTPSTQFVYESADEHIQVDVTAPARPSSASRASRSTTSPSYWYARIATATSGTWARTSTEGSWEAGVDSAKPGIIIPAAPVPNRPYRQEYKACEACPSIGLVLTIDQSTGLHEDLISKTP